MDDGYVGLIDLSFFLIFSFLSNCLLFILTYHNIAYYSEIQDYTKLEEYVPHSVLALTWDGTKSVHALAIFVVILALSSLSESSDAILNSCVKIFTKMTSKRQWLMTKSESRSPFSFSHHMNLRISPPNWQCIQQSSSINKFQLVINH